MDDSNCGRRICCTAGNRSTCMSDPSTHHKARKDRRLLFLQMKVDYPTLRLSRKKTGYSDWAKVGTANTYCALTCHISAILAHLKRR